MRHNRAAFMSPVGCGNSRELLGAMRPFMSPMGCGNSREMLEVL